MIGNGATAAAAMTPVKEYRVDGKQGSRDCPGSVDGFQGVGWLQCNGPQGVSLAFRKTEPWPLD